jgi:hypothetical protein
MKKPSCRRTDVERDQHARAVRLRKMTDAQICEYLDSLKGQKPKGEVENFLKNLNLPGVGKVTIKKLEREARRLGYVESGEVSD